MAAGDKSDRLRELVGRIDGRRGDVDVDWAGLPEGWRGRDYRLTFADETRWEHANRVRASVAEGVAPVAALGFAEWLIGE